MNDEVKEAVSACRNAGHLGNVKIQFRNTVVDAYLAELDETPISDATMKGLLPIIPGIGYDINKRFGFMNSKDGWGLYIVVVDMDGEECDTQMVCRVKTIGQVRTLLRVFGVKGGEKK